MNYERILVLLVMILSAGCSAGSRMPPAQPKPEIMRAYFSQVSKYDGIDLREAVILAKSELVFRGVEENFYINNPQMESIDRDHWGVRFYPVNEGRRDAIENASVLVVVAKRDGGITWYPDGLSYIFLDPVAGAVKDEVEIKEFSY